MGMTPSPLLLADSSACLRWLVLRELLNLPTDHPEVIELDQMRLQDPLVAELVKSQSADGSWEPGSLGLHWGSGSRILATAYALNRFGYLGFGSQYPFVQIAAHYLFQYQQLDGSWPISREGPVLDGHMAVERGGAYSMIPLQTAFPLRGLSACGFAQDERAERAYDWLLSQRLPDGAWPTGLAAGVHGYVAGYRRIAHSRWGCRSNTTGALICLAQHPQRSKGSEARRALDLLLGRETREETQLGFETARMIGAEEPHGFISYFAKFDGGLLLDLCWRVGASTEDERVAELRDFIEEQCGPYGLWTYSSQPQAARWVSFHLTRSLMRLADGGDWVGSEPRTPFQPYPKQKRRY
jgi:hypothetical protein